MRAGCAWARSMVRRGERRDSKSVSVVMANRTDKTPPKVFRESAYFPVPLLGRDRWLGSVCDPRTPRAAGMLVYRQLYSEGQPRASTLW